MESRSQYYESKQASTKIKQKYLSTNTLGIGVAVDSGDMVITSGDGRLRGGSSLLYVVRKKTNVV